MLPSYPPCALLDVAASARESAEGKQTCTLAAPFSCSQFEFNMKKCLHKDAKVGTWLSVVGAHEQIQQRRIRKLRTAMSLNCEAAAS